MGLFRRGGIWWMSFVYNGRQIRKSTETDDRKLAKRIFDKIKGEIAEGKWFERLPGEDYTFKDLMDKYRDEYSLRNKAPTSSLRDKSLAKHLNDFFGEMVITEISARDISKYKVKRIGENASPRTVNYELTLMSHAYNLAIREWEWVRDNPVKKVAREKVHTKMERWLTLEEEKRLLAASPLWLREIVIFAINTGFRESEILDLKWSQIDLKRGTVIISEQKNRGVDTLPICETVMNLLKLKSNGKKFAADDLVFPSLNNTRIIHRNLFRAFKEACARAEIGNMRFHDLRHTFATRLIQHGADHYKVQKLGRWRHPAMIMRYAHHNPESLRSAIELMDRINGGDITILSQSPKEKGSKPRLRLVTP